MARTFEDIFSESQINMIRAGMEFASFREEVELVYIYVYKEEDNALGYNWFYRIKGQIFPKGRINTVLNSPEKPFEQRRARDYFPILRENVSNIYTACKEFDREMPTEMKIIYDAKTHKVSADYNYAPLVSTDPKLPWDGEEKWMQEEAAKLGQELVI